MPIDWSLFVEKIRAAERFVLTSHVKPDCDALGSELGMAGVLEGLGKQVTILNADPVPEHLQFIDPAGRIQVLDPAAPQPALAAADVLMVLDTSAWGQLGAMAEAFRAASCTKLVLDHHVSSDDLGALEFKDPTSAATGCLVFEAARQLEVEITPEIAAALFAAIATDTGWYRFPSATGDVYRIAAELLDAGADPPQLFAALYEQQSLNRLQLAGRILSRVQTDLAGRLVFAGVRSEDFAATGTSPADTEDVINNLLKVGGTEVAVLFTEKPEGGVKMSFRSRGGLDVSRLAERFGGGGHKAAAGAFQPGQFDEVVAQVLDALRQGMR